MSQLMTILQYKGVCIERSKGCTWCACHQMVVRAWGDDNSYRHTHASHAPPRVTLWPRPPHVISAAPRQIDLSKFHHQTCENICCCSVVGGRIYIHQGGRGEVLFLWVRVGDTKPPVRWRCSWSKRRTFCSFPWLLYRRHHDCGPAPDKFTKPQPSLFHHLTPTFCSRAWRNKEQTNGV